MSAKITCQICFDDVNSDECITCNNYKCGKEICKSCIERWMEEKKVISCPLCNIAFTRAFIVEHIGTYIFPKYAEIEKAGLLIKEKLFIPQVVEMLKYPQMIEKMEAEIKHYEDQTNKYVDMKLSKLRKSKELKNIFDHKDFTNEEVCDYYEELINERSTRINEMENVLLGINAISTSELKIQPVCPCPVDNCKGYIKSDNHNCCLCNTCICKHCHIVISKEHVCKEENVESVKNLLLETKACPTCGTRIFKTDGCDQMFCVKCDTAFSWTTLAIDKGRIHNPHYLEKLKNRNIQLPREGNDRPCGRDILSGYYACTENLPPKYLIKTNIEHAHQFMLMSVGKALLCINGMIGHNRYVFESLRNKYIRFGNPITSIRFKYVKNEISETEFIDHIYNEHVRKTFMEEAELELAHNMDTCEYVLHKANECAQEFAREYYVHVQISANITEEDKIYTMKSCRRLYDEYILDICKHIELVKELLQTLKQNLIHITSLYRRQDTKEFDFDLVKFNLNEENSDVISSYMKGVELFRKEFSMW